MNTNDLFFDDSVLTFCHEQNVEGTSLGSPNCACDCDACDNCDCGGSWNC